jgi:hypothetical protein
VASTKETAEMTTEKQTDCNNGTIKVCRKNNKSLSQMTSRGGGE